MAAERETPEALASRLAETLWPERWPLTAHGEATMADAIRERDAARDRQWAEAVRAGGEALRALLAEVAP